MVNAFLSCGSPSLPALPVPGYCGAGASLVLSQVRAVLIAPKGSKPLTDWTDRDTIEAYVANTETINTGPKWLEGVGEIPEPQEVTTVLGRDHKVVTRRVYTLSMDVRQMTDGTYELIRQLQKNWTGFHFWFYTIGGHFIGGETGIDPAYTSASFPYGPATSDTAVGRVRLEWYADGDPAVRAYLPDLFGVTSTVTASTGTYPGPFTGDAQANANGVEVDELYRLARVNDYDLPSANGRLLVVRTDDGATTDYPGPYSGDTDAASNGVALGELYRLAVVNDYDMPTAGGRLIVARTDGGAITSYKGPFSGDVQAASGGVAGGEAYLLAALNDYDGVSAYGRTLAVRS